MKPLSRNIQPGDLFYIPAVNKDGAHGYVVARFIELIEPNVGYLIEVFARFYTRFLEAIDQVDTEERLFRPVMFDLYFQKIPKWKILFSDEGYDKSQSDYSSIVIAFPATLWIGGEGKIPPRDSNQLREYEDSTCWRTHHLIFRVNAHLAGIFGSGDPYDYHLVPKGERVDDPQALEKVIALANEIDHRFRKWAKGTAP